MTQQIDDIMDELTEFVKDLCISITVNSQAEITEDTPVDTGWARANWIPQVARPDLQERGSTGSTAQAERQVQQGLTSVFRYNNLDKKLFITNNVPYIERLNEGSSTQAPAAFVQMAIARVIEAETRRRN